MHTVKNALHFILALSIELLQLNEPKPHTHHFRIFSSSEVKIKQFWSVSIELIQLLCIAVAVNSMIWLDILR
jgi:hypothetical protein